MKTLFVLLGPTGVGKTELSLSIAGRLSCPIVNADSRQIYRSLAIGTAAPTQAEQARVPHYFVGTLPLQQAFSAAQYEAAATAVIDNLFRTHDNLLLCGGSMLYIDAVCHGMDDLPTIDEATRHHFQQRLEEEGLEALTEELRRLDPAWYERVDRKNARRVVHALEICHLSGKPYSTLLGQRQTARPYRILKIGLQRERDDLYKRIDQRVDAMMTNGLREEARAVYPLRTLNALNTVGYKELFEYFDGHCSLQMAVEKIKHNTHVYARKQMTWFNRDGAVIWFRADKQQQVLDTISYVAACR